MKTRQTGDLPLPEDCRVRLVDLPVQAGGLIAVDETGFVNIYLNARLSHDAQRKALQHELRHYYRGDLYSDEDIRTVERRAELPDIETLDGVPLNAPPTAFDPRALDRIGPGFYRPTGENLARAAAHLETLRALLSEACRIYDVMQTPPIWDMDALAAPVGALSAEDIAFVTWQGAEERCPAVMHFSRENLYGALYYASDGTPDNALAMLTVGDLRVSVDIRRRRGRLDVCGITREIGERVERVY